MTHYIDRPIVAFGIKLCGRPKHSHRQSDRLSSVWKQWWQWRNLSCMGLFLFLLLFFLFLVLSSFFFVFFQRDTAELSVSHPRNALDVLMYADARNSDGWRHLSKGYIGSYIAEHAALVWLSQQKCVNIFIKIFKLYGLTPLCFMFLRVTLELTVQCMLACAYTDITYCVAMPQAPE